jgi:hypothetical protein
MSDFVWLPETPLKWEVRASERVHHTKPVEAWAGVPLGLLHSLIVCQLALPRK